MTGKLYLVPTPLDFGTLGSDTAAPDLRDVLPLQTLQVAARLGHWVAENAKTTRAFLKRVHAVVPLAQALQDIRIQELPRPPKGGAASRQAAPAADVLDGLLAAALQGHDVGLVSEAGMPAIADPGAELVRRAHELGLQVLPLVGPSALLLALAASGMNGQSFAFVGYLPVEEAARAARIRELEALARRSGQTQMMIETPYRNPALLAALLANLQAATRLSVACGLTLASGWNRSMTVQGWKQPGAPALPADVPAVFAIHGA
ncbi:SAM-dependent methyltransferase [Eleftheria terrae]|uniref:SAM-dependent methyltransferase n=1 Tax=Eleftheria terrae TaxID=1597781 RepID=UPI00263ABB9F|nr:SAM-dependent methyltransferase [Eleftheria terrae]WKB54599.1 SAM-dependent methyltransferase [Eleftheria terrae]